VHTRFRILIEKSALAGIDEINFNRWLSNFHTDKEKYFAAQVLDNLTFRSEMMLASSIHHIVSSILPCELRRNGFWSGSVDEFVGATHEYSGSLPLRFVEVEDKSGTGLKGLLSEFAR
jgi:hypothetical protein